MSTSQSSTSEADPVRAPGLFNASDISAALRARLNDRETSRAARAPQFADAVAFYNGAVAQTPCLDDRIAAMRARVFADGAGYERYVGRIVENNPGWHRGEVNLFGDSPVPSWQVGRPAEFDPLHAWQFACFTNGEAIANALERAIRKVIPDDPSLKTQAQIDGECAAAYARVQELQRELDEIDEELRTLRGVPAAR